MISLEFAIIAIATFVVLYLLYDWPTIEYDDLDLVATGHNCPRCDATLYAERDAKEPLVYRCCDCRFEGLRRGSLVSKYWSRVRP